MYQHDDVEDMCDEIAEILEHDAKSESNAIIIRGWNSVVGDESYRNIV